MNCWATEYLKTAAMPGLMRPVNMGAVGVGTHAMPNLPLSLPKRAPMSVKPEMLPDAPNIMAQPKIKMAFAAAYFDMLSA